MRKYDYKSADEIINMVRERVLYAIDYSIAGCLCSDEKSIKAMHRIVGINHVYRDIVDELQRERDDDEE